MGQDRRRPSSEAHVSTRRIGEIAESTVRRLLDATGEREESPVELPDVAADPDVTAASASVAGLLALEPAYPVPSVSYMGRLDWALRSLEVALPTLRPLAEMWEQEAADSDDGPDIGRAFGPLVGRVVTDVAGRSLGDLDTHLPVGRGTDALTLPIENLASFSVSMDIPLASLVRWSIAGSIVGRLLMGKTLVGARLSLLALRYRLEVKRYPGSAFGRELLGQMESGSIDMDRLMGSRTARQIEIAEKVARLSAAIDSLALVAWREIDPDHTAGVESRLVESLRRRRASQSSPETVAEFWLGAPIGAVIDSDVDRFVRDLAGSPGGLAGLVRGETTAQIPGTGLIKVGDSPIPGRPRTASLTAWPRGETREVVEGQERLATRLRAALGSVSNSTHADVIEGRIEGLSTPVDERTAVSVRSASVSRRSGVFTSWLQLWLMSHGVTLDGQLERATATYAAVAATKEGYSLLRSEDHMSLLRLHVRAAIQVERGCGPLESGLELALFAWLGATAPRSIGAPLLASWRATRDQRLRATGGMNP